MLATLPTTQTDERGSGRIAAYQPTIHTFRLVLRDRFDQESFETIRLDNDRFCNVIAAVRAQFSGKEIVDSWETVPDLIGL